MILAGIAVARFVHLAAAMLLFGAWAYLIWGLAGTRFAAARDRLAPSLRRVLAASAIAAAASGLAWAALTIANIGGGLASAGDPQVWALVLAETDFGAVWAARLALALLLSGMLILGLRRPSSILDLACLVLGGTLLLSLALVGHTQDREGAARLVHMAADALHLAGASAWLGGLLPLGLLLARAGQMPLETVHAAVGRFSAVGYVAVGSLAASGVVNSYFLVGDPGGLVSTLYGRLLLAKLALFAAMVGLAAVNRFRITPQILAEARGGAGASEGVRRLRRNVVVEQSLGALVLSLVAVLGTIAPASTG